jgi:hypothetical protein
MPSESKEKQEGPGKGEAYQRQNPPITNLRLREPYGPACILTIVRVRTSMN